MAQTNYKRTLTGSVGAGLGSVFSSTGKSYYILEHKVSSKYHHAGEAQEIIVDEAELGRDAKCQVQFDESFTTVSRRHAAIVRDGENWKLVQLSQTNKTFLNGHPVTTEWYLQNGDEIQLSVNGPKLGFIIPQGAKAKTGSIALSRRLSLFRQQALRPYKTAMAAMAVVIVLLIGGGTGVGIWLGKENAKLKEGAVLTQTQINEAQQALVEAQARQEALSRELNKTKRDLTRAIQSLPSQTTVPDAVPKVNAVSTTGNDALDAVLPYIYFVYIRKVEISFEGQTKTVEGLGSGTGFLLSDGRFVTARHVVEPWMFPSGEDDTQNIAINAIAHSGGTVKCYIDAYSPTGKQLHFVSTNAKTDPSSDKRYAMDGGATIAIPQELSADWASFRTSEQGGLAFHNALSRELKMTTELQVLGYPLGLGANSPTDISPIFATAQVAKQGLEHGMIATTNSGYEHGNSGGPVFATTTDGKLLVVGLVSSGAGRGLGLIVPIAAVK